MDTTDVILRYLYLGTTQPYYIYKSKSLDVGLGRLVLEPIKILVQAAENPNDLELRAKAEKISLREEPVDTIVRAINSGSLPRRDECLFTLAYLIRTYKKPEEKHRVYRVLPNLIAEGKELFQFVQFYQILAEPKETGFGNGMRKALTKWYDRHTADELAKLLVTDRGAYGWTHRDILRQAHVQLADTAKTQVLLIVKGPGTLEKFRKTEYTGKYVDAVYGALEVESEALTMFNQMKKFKALDTADKACNGITEQQYPFELVPVPLLRSAAVWESLFPRLPYRDILRAAVLLQDFRLLKENDSPLSVAYGNVLNRMTSVRESRLHPIVIYRLMRLFEERQRYHNAVKEAIHTSNNLTLKNSKANPTVLKQFYAVLNESMLNYERTGLRFLVTLDLRSKQSKKRVFGNRLMSCQAAYILLTLPIVKREPHVTVLSFTEKPEELKKVNLSREMDFFKACDHIQNAAVKKTNVQLTRPIEYAEENKMPVDVFITIVDSLIRVNPKRRSPVVKLNAYNKAMKQKARFVIVNLSRHNRDLEHDDMNSTSGVLELAGCAEDAPKLIDAYVKRHFT